MLIAANQVASNDILQVCTQLNQPTWHTWLKWLELSEWLRHCCHILAFCSIELNRLYNVHVLYECICAYVTNCNRTNSSGTNDFPSETPPTRMASLTAIMMTPQYVRMNDKLNFVCDYQKKKKQQHDFSAELLSRYLCRWITLQIKLGNI